MQSFCVWQIMGWVFLLQLQLLHHELPGDWACDKTWTSLTTVVFCRIIIDCRRLVVVGLSWAMLERGEYLNAICLYQFHSCSYGIYRDGGCWDAVCLPYIPNWCHNANCKQCNVDNHRPTVGMVRSQFLVPLPHSCMLVVVVAVICCEL